MEKTVWLLIITLIIFCWNGGSGDPVSASGQTTDSLQVISIKGRFLGPGGKTIQEYDYLEPNHKYHLLPETEVQFSTLDGKNIYEAIGPGVISLDFSGSVLLNETALIPKGQASFLQGVTAAKVPSNELAGIPLRRLQIVPDQEKRSSIHEVDGYAYLGENTTLGQARKAAFANAKRQALEMARTRIESNTLVKDGKLQYDLIQSGAEGYVSVLEQKDHGLKGNRYHVWIRAEVEYGLKPTDTQPDSNQILSPEAPLTVKAILEKLSGTIEVTGKPTGAKVYLDGYYTGVLPVDPTEIELGPHTVKVVMKGYHKVEETISVGAGRAVRLRVDLKPVEKAVSEPKTFTNSLGMKFVKIPSGSFMMGSGISASEVKQQYGGKEEWYKDEHPQHRVTVSKPFYMQTTEVTQGQWERVMGSNPSRFKDCGDDCPVEKVSWNDVQEFIGKLNQMEGGNKYRLPTEAEWEYAARAGSTTRFFFGNDDGQLGQYAWYDSNSGNKTHSVAQKKPNTWGLYDMQGNVYEWCQDWFGDYPSGSVTDPTGPPSGSYRVYRGGSWYGFARLCRSAYRSRDTPGNRSNGLGFRLARTP